MNREIKFRRPHFKISDNSFSHFEYWGIDFPQKGMNKFPGSSNFTFCKEDQQYTGLLDKNGKEIYEGDIIQTLVNECINKDELREAAKTEDMFIMPEYKKVNKICQIDYYIGISECGFRLLGKNKRFHTQLKKSTIFNMNAEVIGNIYENPELINRK